MEKMKELVGKTLNRYKILSLLGEGGMGAVFKAHDLTLQRDVAIKVLYPHFARQGDFQERFLQEARSAARLDHPSIVQVHDFGQDQGYLYIVMEFIPGDNLDKMLEQLRAQGKWILLNEAVLLIRQIALALDYAHRQGVLHRDIKPGNIMIEPEASDGLPYRPVITDLGLAKLAGGAVVTQDGTYLGTPAYMSPEQTLGEPTDARSDVYSLGVLLFELCTGQLPFPAASLFEARKFHAETPPPSPRLSRPDLPDILEQAILKSMAKDPNKRFQSAAEFAEFLKKVSQDTKKITSAPSTLQGTVSLFTQYQQSLVEKRGASILEEFETPADISRDRIQVLAQDKTTRTILAKKEGMIIGREATCDIQIDDHKVSRQHARIEFDGHNYRVQDLNSTNGTFVGNIRLMPGVSQIWSPDQPLRVGDTYLRLLTPKVVGAPIEATLKVAPEPIPGTVRVPSPVSPVVQFQASLESPRIKANQIGRARIVNQGNAPQQFNLSWRDPADALMFTPSTLTISVPPGKSAVVEFRAAPRSPAWIGGEKTRLYQMTVQGESGTPQVLQGEVLSRGMLPVWIAPLLLLLCAMIVGGILFLGGDVLVQNRSATQTASEKTEVALLAQQTQLVITATSKALENAIQATHAMATATAEWLDADSDGDGLVNAKELEAGTSPQNPDSDGDGVSDTKELNQGTNPTNPDSDQDGLNDGEEIAIGSNPLNPDSDADGVPDGTDSAPLLTSTPTLDIAATQFWAATQTQAAYQASINATSTAVAANATGTALAANATAQMAATLTAAAQKKIAYIYSSDNPTANNFYDFLGENGYSVDLIHISSVMATNFNLYHVIIVGYDTGNGSDWGDAGGSMASHIASFGKPILGMGEGGYAYFGKLSLLIGYPNGAHGSAKNVQVVDFANPIWNTPNHVSIPGDGIISLYNSDVNFAAIYYPTPLMGTEAIARITTSPNHYPLITQVGPFFLWGFDGRPASMSNKGQKIFINVIEYLIPG